MVIFTLLAFLSLSFLLHCALRMAGQEAFFEAPLMARLIVGVGAIPAGVLVFIFTHEAWGYLWEDIVELLQDTPTYLKDLWRGGE